MVLDFEKIWGEGVEYIFACRMGVIAPRARGSSSLFPVFVAFRLVSVIGFGHFRFRLVLSGHDPSVWLSRSGNVAGSRSIVFSSIASPVRLRANCARLG